MAIAGVTPTGSWLKKISKLPTAGCRLCKRAREARGQSTQELPNETHGHINSAGCEGMAEAVTAAHHPPSGDICLTVFMLQRRKNACSSSSRSTKKAIRERFGKGRNLLTCAASSRCRKRHRKLKKSYQFYSINRQYCIQT